jgi:hypothetical protein
MKRSLSGLLAATTLCCGPVAGGMAAAAAQPLSSQLPGNSLAPWHESPLWAQSSAAPQSPLQYAAATSAIVDQISLLARLRDWRDTMRGSGKLPTRTFGFKEGRLPRLNLIVGAQQLPGFELAGMGSHATGAGLATGRISFGTTYGASIVNAAMRSYDHLMDGVTTQDGPRDASHMTWLTARPIATKAAQLDLILAHGVRDLAPGQSDDKQYAAGRLWGGRGNATLPHAWKLRGEWLQSRLDSQSKAATAWKLGLNGPLAHPWGVAQATIDLSDTAPGFATFNAPVPTIGERNSALTLRQSIAAGPLAGSLAASAVAHRCTDPAALGAGALHIDDKTDFSSDLHWQLSPVLALTGSGSLTTTAQQAGITQTEQVVAAPATNTTRGSADLGVQLRLSHSLALTVSGGKSRIVTRLPASNSLDAANPVAADSDQLDTADNEANGANNGGADAGAVSVQADDSVALGLQHTTANGSWGLHYIRHNLNDTGCAPIVAGSSSISTDSVSLSAARQLTPSLRLKASYLWSADDDLLQRLRRQSATRSAEAQLVLPSLGRFNVLYADWDGAQGLSADGIPLAGTRQYGVRVDMGSADHGGGLGLSLQYSLQDARVGTDLATWKVGLTYK